MKVDYFGLVLDILFILIFWFVSFMGLFDQFKTKRFFIYWAIPLSLVVSFLINWFFDPVSHFYKTTYQP